MMLKKFIVLILVLCLSPLSQTIYCSWQAPQNTALKQVVMGNEVSPPLNEYQFSLIMEMVVRYNPRLSVWSRHRIVDQVIKASEEFKLDPFLIASVIAAESSFRPLVISHCGAQGLMQLTPAVQPSLGVHNAFNIEENIRGGCLFLSQLSRRFNDTTLTLAAYNAGPTRVARLGRVPRIRETQCYVRRVQNLATKLTQSFIAKLPSSFIEGIKPILRSEALQSFMASTKANEWHPGVYDSSVHSIRFLSALSQKESFNALAPVTFSGKPLFFQQILSQSLESPIRT